MSIHEIYRPSNLDLGQDGAIARQEAEAESQGIEGGGERRHNSAEQEVEPDEEQDETPASAPPLLRMQPARRRFSGQ